MSNRRILPCLAAVIWLAAPPALAQNALIVEDAMLVQGVQNQLDVQRARLLAGVDSVIVPTILLHVSLEGQLRVTNASTSSSATAETEYSVAGLTREFVNELLRYAEMDLLARLERKGIAARGFDAVRGKASVARLALLQADTVFGVPTVRNNRLHSTYGILAASDSQLFKAEAEQLHLVFAELAKETNSVVLVPEFWFNAPQLESQRGFRLDGLSAQASVATGMDMYHASLGFITPGGEAGRISLRSPVLGVGDAVGELSRVGADSTDFGGGATASYTELMRRRGTRGIGMTHTPGGTRRSSHSYLLVVRDGDYSVAVLRGVASFVEAALSAAGRQ